MNVISMWLDKYRFEVVGPNVTWKPVGAVYIFSYFDVALNYWPALYIGQAASLAERLPSHERWEEATRLGATHIHVHVEPDQARRDAIEAELISTFQPPLNVQLR
jgi:excinuclease UvrABC nuclease subunit